MRLLAMAAVAFLLLGCGTAPEPSAQAPTGTPNDRYAGDAKTP